MNIWLLINLWLQGMSLDDVNIGNYGIIVSDYEEEFKASAIKTNLLVSNSVTKGVTYDAEKSVI